MTLRDQSGKFRKGSSGNPSGKPKSLLNKNTKSRNEFLSKISPKFFKELESMLNDKDNPEVRREAVKILADRLLPKLKPVETPLNIDIPEMLNSGDAVKVISILTQLVAEGKLTPSEGQELSKTVEIFRRTLETEELEKRITLLEKSKN